MMETQEAVSTKKASERVHLAREHQGGLAEGR